MFYKNQQSIEVYKLTIFSSFVLALHTFLYNAVIVTQFRRSVFFDTS